LIDPSLIDRENWDEHYVKKGDPSKPTYYIIRHKYKGVGLFAYYKIFGEHIRYALSNGWLPVIDMQNYPNFFMDPEKLGKENAWEYYFEQPLRIGLEQAYNGENIILSSVEVEPRLYESMAFFENRDNILSEWRMLVKLGLLKVKPEHTKEIMALREKLFSPKDRVIGVHLRGTDYVVDRPFGHPIPPPVELAANTVVAKLNEWNCNKFFLSTEDNSIVKVFKHIFGDLCVTIERKYVDYDPQKSLFPSLMNENENFIRAKDYLTQVVILSTCNSFIASRCSGAVGAMMMAENFENVFAFNLGRYGIIFLD
jgi:hypothetical protein